MKKLILTIAMTLFYAASSFSQRVVMANYLDTITDAQTKYYPAAIQPELVTASLWGYVDHLSGSTDSTYVSLQGSIDGTNWFGLYSTAYTDIVAVGSTPPTDFKTVRFSTTDAGQGWLITSPLALPFYRFAVTHYATGTVRFKASMYKKK